MPVQYEVSLKPGEPWTLAKQYDVMMLCEHVPLLRGIRPLYRIEGGFYWPVSPSDDDGYQIRTCATTWNYTVLQCDATWKVDLPRQTNFHTDMCPFFVRGVIGRTPGFTLRERYAQQAPRLAALAGVFMALGYTVRPVGR